MPYLNVIGNGDSVEYLKQVPNDSVDAATGDPPYGLGDEPDVTAVMKAWLTGDEFVPKNKGGFMGASWDAFVPGPPIWREVYRILKPGGYCLMAFGTRTYDWGVMAMRIAGFEIVDSVVWHHVTGFPKSLNISKAVDAFLTTGHSDSKALKHANDEVRDGDGRERSSTTNNGIMGETLGSRTIRDEPATEIGKRWQGWGTQLKPAAELFVVARKPFSGTFVENVLEHGTGAMNIDSARIETTDNLNGGTYSGGKAAKPVIPGDTRSAKAAGRFGEDGRLAPDQFVQPAGRWPTNAIFNHIEGCKLRGARKVRSNGHHPAARGKGGVSTTGHSGQDDLVERKSAEESIEDWVCGSGCPVAELDRQRDAGSRFFYCPKAATKSRWAYCEDCDLVFKHSKGTFETHKEHKVISHPTQKPIKLMEYLIKLVTQPGGVVVDPFCGCYDSQTEVLTERGFVPWPKATKEDLYATRSADGQIMFVSPSALIRKQHVGVMHHYQGRSVDLLVTPNHNMLFREHHAEEAVLVPSEEAVASVYHIPNQAIWSAPNVDTLRVGEIELPADEWLRFFGLYVAEGHVNRKRGYGVLVKQSKSAEFVNAVRHVFHALGNVSRQREHTYGDLTLFVLQERNMHAACAAVGYQHERRIPRSYMNLGPRNLTALYEGLMLGDGCETMGGRECYFTCSPGLADDVAELMIRLGRAATISARRRKQHRIGDRLIINQRVQYTVRARYAKELKVTTKKMRTEVPFNGVVHCVVVPPHHTLLVKRNGKVAWCGNTGTTAVAAKRLGYNFITCELDARYAKIAEARVGTVGKEHLSALTSGAVFCPSCKARGEIKLIAEATLKQSQATGKKITCSKCFKRYSYEALSNG